MGFSFFYWFHSITLALTICLLATIARAADSGAAPIAQATPATGTAVDKQSQPD
ncbi:MAG: hypothetical protein JWM69_1328, partial [Candidatus Binatus sp.]|nr:hypothetical protein [Candidatus Binatus sp.]